MKESMESHNWPMRTIGSFCKVVRGSSPRPAGSHLYFNGDYLPWITVGDVTSHNQMHLRSTASMLTEEGAKQTRIIQPNTLILTNSGATLGVPKITTFLAGANDGIAAFLNVNGVESEFLYFALQAKTAFMRERLAPGVGQPNLNTDLIAEILVPMPSCGEQKKIATILSTWDRAVELTEKLIAAKRERKASLMQQLLTGKVRLPGHTDDWRVEQIGQYLEECSSRVSATTSLPIYTSSRAGLKPQEEYYAGKTVTNEGEYGVVPVNCFVFRHMSDDGLFVFHINQTGGDIAVSKEYPVFRAVNLDRHFLLAKLNHGPDFRAFAVTQKAGGTRTRLYFSKLRLWKTLLPSLPGQQAIATVLNTASEEIALLTRKLDALRRQKKGLMQLLLTGKVRVTVTESSAE